MQHLRRFWYAFALGFMLLGIILGSWLLGLFSSGQKQDARSPVAGVATATAIARPSPTATPYLLPSDARLVIPAINVNAPIEAVGILQGYVMAVPTLHPWTSVGWYRYGTAPGAKGSAVIDGHLDRPGGAPAVFWRLRDLHPGDIVKLLNGHDTLRYRVLSLNYYKPTEAPTRQIFMNQSGTFLNLITCAGYWVPSEHQTTLRLVVYTTLIP